MSKNIIEIDRRQLRQALSDIERRGKRLDERTLRKFKRRALKPMVQAMKSNSKSVSLMGMIGVTARKKYAPANGVRVGVVKNDKSKFPKINAQGLAAILEYGTDERFQPIRRAGLVVGRRSVGKITASPFIRPAYDANINKAVRDIEQDIEREFQK